MASPLRMLRTLALAATLAVARLAAADPAAPAIAPTNAPDGLALRGWDPVAYFAEGRAREGSPAHTARHGGATYRFASAEHRDRFVAEPARYAPQYGGYCAFAMSIDGVADADPERWVIVDGKLYVNKNRIAAGLWSIGTAGRIAAADGYWPTFAKTPVAP